MENKEEKIDPDKIVFDDCTDADMPQPETADYSDKNDVNNKTLTLTVKGLKLFEECLGKLPYNTIFKSGDNKAIKLTDLMKFIETKSNGMLVKEMNTIISFIVTAPLDIIKPLMEIIEDNNRQSELWTVK